MSVGLPWSIVGDDDAQLLIMQQAGAPPVSASVIVVTVTADGMTDGLGNPARGFVRFTLAQPLRFDDIVVMPVPQIVPFDGSGSFSVQLAATTNAAHPTKYAVEEHRRGRTQVHRYFIALDDSLATVALSDVSHDATAA